MNCATTWRWWWPIDVATLVTGLVGLGIGALVLWLLTGHRLTEPAAMWFAAVPLVSGAVGLVLTLRRAANRNH